MRGSDRFRTVQSFRFDNCRERFIPINMTWSPPRCGSGQTVYYFNIFGASRTHRYFIVRYFRHICMTSQYRLIPYLTVESQYRMDAVQ